MRNIVCSLLLTSSFVAGAISSAQAQTQWPEVNQSAKPWTRWWWMGSAVDEKNIQSQLKTYAGAGFGGVEIVPIYGAKGFESKYISYLSPSWMKMLDYSVKQASTLNMGVDVSVGTGWPIGGPQVSAQDAATKLIIQDYPAKFGERFQKIISIEDPKQQNTPGTGLAAVIAYGSNGGIIELTDKVAADGMLDWSPPDAGTWTIYACFNGKTKQAVKRAAPGGEGFTLDHFSSRSINHYFSRFDSAYGKTARGVRSFYNDSYEVYGANWTPDFFAEFSHRRGYDLKRYIRELASKEQSPLIARIKSDYRETMADLMLEYFSGSFTKWAHGKGALALNQAHGSPGNLLDMYAAVDIAESETFGSSYFPFPGLRRDSADIQDVDPDPIMLKFASSAAHLAGHRFASTETFTWLTDHFKTAWSQCKPELEQVFLSGINHVFYHGTTYSPAEAKWPGWLFYASVNFVPNNSLWPHLKGMNEYVARCQSVLQSGSPDNEIMVYWPVYDAWNNAKGMDMPFKVHDIDRWLHPTPFYKNIVQLQEQGYPVDFVSDLMIRNADAENGIIRATKDGAAYKALLIPQCAVMPLETIEQLLRLAEMGATLIWQQLPEDVPGVKDLEARQEKLKQYKAALKFEKINSDVSELKIGKGRIILAADVQKGLVYAGLQREKLTDSGLKFIRRKSGTDKFYYLVNHTADAIDAELPINYSAESVVILNPQTGEEGLAYSRKTATGTMVKLQLKPGEALILKVGKEKKTMHAWNYYKPAGNTITLNTNWSLRFIKGGPALPAPVVLPQLQSWTLLKDTLTKSFSGTAEYSITFDLGKKTAADYLLDLGRVNESAKLRVNGKEIGILWSIPFQANIGKYLKPGKNTITIEVANLMANRIADMDRKAEVWRNYHEINFVNIKYKNFDASNWAPQTSGLIGPVTITPLQNQFPIKAD